MSPVEGSQENGSIATTAHGHHYCRQYRRCRTLRGLRRMLVSEFVIDGYRTSLEPDELVTKFILPALATQPLSIHYL
ncbi:TPA_asm: hypothetical protein G4Q23_004907 [Salmonella enterica subsp. enterica serovar Eastbourne]|nr:hypothetical protein [Salmonella enterica]HAE5116422.1 hypothetical protein [Salmonella enterica subsp. enterica serovar Eastbourne]HAE8030823.1 hypothetical protein [Salmonella enterica subsp. enterica serovar Eastbourne]